MSYFCSLYFFEQCILHSLYTIYIFPITPLAYVLAEACVFVCVEATPTLNTGN